MNKTNKLAADYEKEIERLKSSNEFLEFETKLNFEVEQANNKLFAQLNTMIVEQDKQIRKLAKAITEIEKVTLRDEKELLNERLSSLHSWEGEIYGTQKE